MNHKGTIQIETERLILRRFTIDDAPAMFKNWASDPEVTKFMTWPTHKDVGVSKWVLDSWIPSYEKDDYYVWAITLKENGAEPIGNIHGLPKDEIEAVEFGYAIGKKWWHQGIMTEVLHAVIDFFFEQVGVNSVRAYHDPNNPNSGKVMKKCGMKYEGTLRSADRNNQGIVDQCWYSILRSEWEVQSPWQQQKIYGVVILDLEIKAATAEDAELLVDIYNKAFYEDFVKYGECPGYGKSVSDMEKSINETSKYIAYVGSAAVGAISILKKDDGLYYLGALCVIPEYQRQGIGCKLLEFIKDKYKDWKKIELVTPADKEKNIKFYTKKCGFTIDSEEMDGNVRVYHFSLENR